MKHISLILLSLLIFTKSVVTAKTVKVLPEDVIKSLLVDAKKYERNKWRSAAIAGTTFSTGIIIAAFGKRTDIAAVPVMGGIITGGYSCWMWWSEKRSLRQAHELAQEHGIQIIEHTPTTITGTPETREHDNSEKLEHPQDKTTQTGD